MQVFSNKLNVLRTQTRLSLLKLLKKSFTTDPHTREFFTTNDKANLLETKRYDAFMLYNLDHAYTQGFIACDDNLKSVGLFAYIGKTKFSWKFHIVANLRMLKEFGIRGIIRILKIQARVEKSRHDKEFLHLIYLCTGEYCRSQGLAKQVIEYGYQQAKIKNVPLLLETSKSENISYYKKLGFKVYQECVISETKLKIYFLRKDIE